VRIVRTARFKKAWKGLNKEEKSLGRKAITSLLDNIRYPSLMVKQMQGIEGVWEARVSRSVRLTFEISGDTVILRNIGNHNDTLGRP
jgi:mRNA interferase RelE/StbE